jgi:hypothetical protein
MESEPGFSLVVFTRSLDANQSPLRSKRSNPSLMRVAGSPGRFTAFAQEDANGFALFRIERLANKTRSISAHLTVRDFFVQAYGQEVHGQPSSTTACKDWHDALI